MGRVFTSEELTTGQIPRPESFKAAAEFILAAADQDFDPIQPTTSMPTIGALVFGSTATGTTTIRSDLDVFIAYESAGRSKSANLLAYRGHFQNVKDIYGVPVESTVELDYNLRAGHHSLDTLFLANLRTVPENWSSSINPLLVTSPRKKSGYEIFGDYAVAKDRKLGKALTDGAELDVKAMQRALELPVALARKAIAVLAEYNVIQQNGSDAAAISKQAALAGLKRISPTGKIPKMALSLVAVDAEYTSLVEAVANGNCRPTDHQAWLVAHYLPVLALAIDYNDELSRHTLNMIRAYSDN